MELRLARREDLPQIQAVYGRIVARMYRMGLRIWDDVYPSAFLEADVGKRRLYVLTDGDSIAAAFALCRSHAGESAVRWAGEGGALYLDRLGVDDAYAGRGIGGVMLDHAMRLARERGAKSLRLFAADGNEPAIALYRKHGFRMAEGVYLQVVDEALTLREYGLEIPL